MSDELRSTEGRTRRICSMHEKKDGERNPNCPDCRGEVLITDGGTSTSDTDHGALVTEFKSGEVHVTTTDAAKTLHTYHFEQVDDDGGLEFDHREYKPNRIPGWDNKSPHKVTDTVREALEAEGYYLVDDAPNNRYVYTGTDQEAGR